MSGRLTLATTGIQGRWLTEEPEYSHFLMNFRQHTKFAFEDIEIPCERFSKFGDVTMCQIPKNKGDLVRSMMLKVTLPPPKMPNETYTVTDNGGQLEIGGSTEITLYQGSTYTFEALDAYTISKTVNGSEYTYDKYPNMITKDGNNTTFTVPYVLPVVPDDEEDAVPYTLYYGKSGVTPVTFKIKSVRWNKSIATRMIDYVDLKIGSQTIERLTGEYIYMYNQLNLNSDDIEFVIKPVTSHNSYPIILFKDYEYRLHLPFYFLRNPSLAIPVCALTKQIVELEIKTKPYDELVVEYDRETGVASAMPSSVIEPEVKSMSVSTDFVFVTEDERNFLLSKPIEYVITQLQMAQFKIKAGQTDRSVMINFDHPVKEMFFVAVSDDLYKHTKITNVNLKFNNNEVIDSDDLMLSSEQPLKHHTGYIDTEHTFGIHSFSIKPEMYYPTGQVNMSRVIHKLLNVKIEESSFDNTVRVYALNYNVLRVESGLAGLKF